MARGTVNKNAGVERQMRLVVRLAAVGIVLVGWLFIFWQNRFHVTAPVVVVCLGYFAIISLVFNLWRTGAATVAEDEAAEADSTWSKSLGARGELEREKKTLLKAIKEAEFDREMGKLSTQDATEMIAIYRARAIEVIKELDRMDAGPKAGSVREQIQREVRARIEILDKTSGAAEAKASKNPKKTKAKGGAKQAADAADKAADAAADKASDAATRARDAAEDAAEARESLDETDAGAVKAANEAKAKADAAIEAATAAVSATKDPAIPRDQVKAAKAAAEAAVAEAEAALARAKEAARAAGADADGTISGSST